MPALVVAAIHLIEERLEASARAWRGRQLGLMNRTQQVSGLNLLS
jgi:hypothetical protein